MFRPLITCLLGSLILLNGCQNTTSKGGSIDSTVTTTEPIFNKNDEQIGEKVTTIHTVVEQPENPNSPAVLEVTEPKSNIKVYATTGGAYNKIAAVLANNLLEIVVWAGVALIIAGLAVGIIFKQVKWAIAMGAMGFAMIIASYLLAQYAVYFLIGFFVLVAWGAWMLFDYFRQYKANNEQAKILAAVKQENIINPSKIKELEEKNLSKSTKKIQEKIIKKLDK